MHETKLKVAFFGDDFSRQGKGTALVIRKIVEELARHHPDEIDITLLRPAGECISPVCTSVRHVIIPRRYSTLLSYLWFFVVHRDQYDVVIFNRVVYPGFFFLRAKKFILYAHDASISEVYSVRRTSMNLAFECFLKYIGKYFMTAVVAVSHDARKWLIQYYALSPEKVHVIYNGVSDEYGTCDADVKMDLCAKLKEKYNVRTPYLLDVSRFDPHKNIERVLDAFFTLKEKSQSPYTTVFVGGRHTPNYSDHIDNKIQSSKFRDDVRVIEYVQQEDMPTLYRCADVLVYPSLVEGFGLPIIEAMKCGTPVVTSNISSMPEVAGGAAMLVDPLDPLAIEGGITAVMDPQVRNDQIKMGLARARDFSWSKSASSLMQLIRHA